VEVWRILTVPFLLPVMEVYKGSSQLVLLTVSSVCDAMNKELQSVLATWNVNFRFTILTGDVESTAESEGCKEIDEDTYEIRNIHKAQIFVQSMDTDCKLDFAAYRASALFVERGCRSDDCKSGDEAN
jgi:hypothetical protein